MASENRVHLLILPKNPVDADAAIREFAASLEETTDDESAEEVDKE